MAAKLWCWDVDSGPPSEGAQEGGADARSVAIAYAMGLHDGDEHEVRTIAVGTSKDDPEPRIFSCVTTVTIDTEASDVDSNARAKALATIKRDREDEAES